MTMTDVSHGSPLAVPPTGTPPDAVITEARRALAAVTREVHLENVRAAEANRRDVDACGVHLVNLVGAPGAGMTALITETVFHTLGLLEVGSVQSPRDGHQLANLGVTVSELTPGELASTPGHLDAAGTRSALRRLPLDELNTVLVQNPLSLQDGALIGVGEHDRVLVHAVTQGHRFPMRHPELFSGLDVVVLTKTDILADSGFDRRCFHEGLQRINPEIRVVEVSARTGDGLETWLDWLLERRRRHPVGSGDRGDGGR